MNIIQLAGRLGADPETRFTSSGQKVISFRIASNTKKQGKEDTIWWKITVWGDRFDRMMPYLKKGSALFVVGELSKPEIYTDRNGDPQISLEITAEMLRFSPFGGAKSNDKPFEPAAQQKQNTVENQEKEASMALESSSVEADDIPF